MDTNSNIIVVWQSNYAELPGIFSQRYKISETVSCDEQINYLIQRVAAIDSNNNAGLTAKLDAAKDAYIDAKGQNYNSAMNKMEAFINACYADSLLDEAEQTELVSAAENIILCIQEMI